MNPFEDTCFLCKKIIPEDKTSFNFEESCTSSYETPLKNLLEEITGIVLIMNPADKVCLSCYRLFDEWDSIKNRSKQIKQLLVLYCENKQFVNVNKIETEEVVLEEEYLTDLLFKNEAISVEKVTTPKPKPKKVSFNNKEIVTVFVKKEENPDITSSNAYESMVDESAYVEPQFENDMTDGSQKVSNINVVQVYVKEVPPNASITRGKRGRPRKKNTLNSRVVTKTAATKTSYLCRFCRKPFKGLQALRIHEEKHKSFNSFICDQCGNAYSSQKSLDTHIGVHNGIYPFTCDICHTNFTLKGTMQRHMRIHTGERNYQCELCGRAFIHSTSFDMHMKFHAGDRQNKCPLCDLAFVQTSHLNRHMRVHSGEKKFACSECGRTFAERYNMVQHMKTHNGKAPKRVRGSESNPRSNYFKVKQSRKPQNLASSNISNSDLGSESFVSTYEIFTSAVE